MRVADTSVLYALFVPRDAQHARARKAIADPAPILVPGEILAETVSLLQYRHGYEVARKAAAFLRSLPHLEVQPTLDGPYEDLLGQAWTTYAMESKGNLSYPDSVVVAWCRRRKLPALAFDEAILKAVKA
ncbi:MAG TPA: PIN domain-containing protein [Candidatus Thermoplasmatota archaeon]|nr:PIN domain-containing protein [Candidatus Thermoplasmatota archaeon]